MLQIFGKIFSQIVLKPCLVKMISWFCGMVNRRKALMVNCQNQCKSFALSPTYKSVFRLCGMQFCCNCNKYTTLASGIFDAASFFIYIYILRQDLHLLPVWTSSNFNELITFEMFQSIIFYKILLTLSFFVSLSS